MNIKDSHRNLLYIKAKIERLSAFCFVVSGQIIKDSDLYKKSVQEKGTELMTFLDHLEHTYQQPIEDTVLDLIAHLRGLESVLRVGVHARLLSAMNYQVVAEEIEGVVALLRDSNKQFAHQLETQQVSLAALLTSVDEVAQPSEEPLSYHALSLPALGAKGHEIERGRDQGHNDLRSELSRTQTRAAVAPGTTPHVSQKTIDTDKKKRDRRSVILGLLQEKERISVKDVAEKITSCSEKTLQRELLAMVEQGLLVKEGERRWSTYGLA